MLWQSMLCAGNVLLSKFRCLGGKCFWPGLSMLWMVVLVLFFVFFFFLIKIKNHSLMDENVRSSSPSPACLGKRRFAPCREELGVWRSLVHRKGWGLYQHLPPGILGYSLALARPGEMQRGWLWSVRGMWPVEETCDALWPLQAASNGP